MDRLSDTRQRKVRELIRDEYESRQVAFADKIGRPDNYVSRIVSSGENRKGIGERMARHIESRCNKPRGWLDGETADSVREQPASTLYGQPITAEAAGVGREWAKLKEPLRTHIAQLIQMLVGAQAREGRSAYKRQANEEMRA